LSQREREGGREGEREREREREREIFIDDHLVRIHLIMAQMILVDRPRATGV
jgi:hypothetical protein